MQQRLQSTENKEDSIDDHGAEDGACDRGSIWWIVRVAHHRVVVGLFQIIICQSWRRTGGGDLICVSEERCGLTLKRAPIMERIIMAKMETTMLVEVRSILGYIGLDGGEAYQDQALKAETTGFILGKMSGGGRVGG